MLWLKPHPYLHIPGLFVPTLLAGAAFGRLIGHWMNSLFPGHVADSGGLDDITITFVESHIESSPSLSRSVIRIIYHTPWTITHNSYHTYISHITYTHAQYTIPHHTHLNRHLRPHRGRCHLGRYGAHDHSRLRDRARGLWQHHLPAASHGHLRCRQICWYVHT